MDGREERRNETNEERRDDCRHRRRPLSPHSLAKINYTYYLMTLSARANERTKAWPKSCLLVTVYPSSPPNQHRITSTPRHLPHSPTLHHSGNERTASSPSTTQHLLDPTTPTGIPFLLCRVRSGKNVVIDWIGTQTAKEPERNALPNLSRTHLSDIQSSGSSHDITPPHPIIDWTLWIGQHFVFQQIAASTDTHHRRRRRLDSGGDRGGGLSLFFFFFFLGGGVWIDRLNQKSHSYNCSS